MMGLLEQEDTPLPLAPFDTIVKTVSNLQYVNIFIAYHYHHLWLLTAVGEWLCLHFIFHFIILFSIFPSNSKGHVIRKCKMTIGRQRSKHYVEVVVVVEVALQLKI